MPIRTAILYYDYALTVASEIEWYWSPPSFSLSSVLFALVRYYGLLGPIPVFFEYFSVDISEAVRVVHSAINANTLKQALQMYGTPPCHLAKSVSMHTGVASCNCITKRTQSSAR